MCRCALALSQMACIMRHDIEERDSKADSGLSVYGCLDAWSLCLRILALCVHLQRMQQQRRPSKSEKVSAILARANSIKYLVRQFLERAPMIIVKAAHSSWGLAHVQTDMSADIPANHQIPPAAY